MGVRQRKKPQKKRVKPGQMSTRRRVMGRVKPVDKNFKSGAITSCSTYARVQRRKKIALRQRKEKHNGL